MEQAYITNIIVAVVFFGFGNFTGYLLRGITDKHIQDKSANSLVLVAVTFVWVVSVLVDILDSNYETPMLLHTLMGAIVGFFYKPILKSGSKDDNK